MLADQFRPFFSGATNELNGGVRSTNDRTTKIPWRKSAALKQGQQRASHHGAVSAALRQAGVSDEEITLFLEESTSGNFDDLLVTAMKWVDVR